MNHKWEHIKDENVFLGDLQEQYGRRILIIVTKGVAVFARCTIEDYHVMKDDFEKMMSDFEFILAAKLTNGIPEFSKELEDSVDIDTLEEITKYLNMSVN